jgi:hypothetical protein
VIIGEGLHLPQDIDLPDKQTAKKATAAKAAAAAARRCVAAALSVIVVAWHAVMTSAVNFHGGGRHFQRFRSASWNGKSTA